MNEIPVSSKTTAMLVECFGCCAHQVRISLLGRASSVLAYQIRQKAIDWGFKEVTPTPEYKARLKKAQIEKMKTNK